MNIYNQGANSQYGDLKIQRMVVMVVEVEMVDKENNLI